MWSSEPARVHPYGQLRGGPGPQSSSFSLMVTARLSQRLSN